jgi:hypothetical protein
MILAKQPSGSVPNDGDVFVREVDEALRADNLQNFFRQYGLWIGGTIAAGLAALAGWIVWQNSQEQAAGVRSEEYVVVVDSLRRNNVDGAANALKPLLTAEQDGYRGAAHLMQANIALEKQDRKAAIAAYKKIAGDSSLPETIQQLALIRQTAAEYDDLKPQQVIDRLKPLAVKDGPWLGSAGELVALAYLEMKQNKAAGAMFGLIARDDAVPDTIRSRARQMAGVLGVDTFVAKDAMAAANTAAQDAAITAAPATTPATESE